MADLVDAKPVDPVPEKTYQPQDALATTTRAIVMTGTAGIFLAAIKNTVAKENIGPFGIFSRFGGTVGTFGMDVCSKSVICPYS